MLHVQLFKWIYGTSIKKELDENMVLMSELKTEKT